ncbi:MAG: 4Fe-4S dicluster domain-containing protein [Clostridia bacterium]|nr:4Fe-4S dicluster domain-containing protein [Clostridia bacterium]
MSKGVLVDITKCVGCGSCTVACKMWNSLGYKKDIPNQGTDAALNEENWTTITYKKVTVNGEPAWRFVKEQCLHCQDPACASVCMSKAIVKTSEGPVVYDPTLCVGCRYCMIACPFEIPKYEWNKVLPSVTKCQMCANKIIKGEQPACVSVCPTQALTFGERNDLLKLAENTIAADSKYVKHIYGQEEAGGTEWLYISDVPFEELGLKTNISKIPLPHYTHEYLKNTPTVFIGGSILFAALSFYTKRRSEVEKHKKS